jgi:hypothetical protein
MSPSDVVNLPPSPKVLNYPGLMAVGFAVMGVSILLFVAGRFDPTGGVLTISLLIVLAFIGVIAVSVFYSIPSDETTSAVIGGLTMSFGALVSYWLRRKEPPQ